MRLPDLLWVAVKTLKGRLSALPAAAIAISTFCLCFAGTVLVTVQQERSSPYELNIAADTQMLSDNALVQLSEIPDVTAVTPVIEVPVSIETGGYEAHLALTGIAAGYIDEVFAQGGAFPDSSVMPYIVLNKAACKLFAEKGADEQTAEETEEPPIDWLRAAVSVQTEASAKSVVAKIVGILSGNDEDQVPAAYISIASAEALLGQQGQNADGMSADVRIKNAGYAADVSEQIRALGLGVINANEVVQAKWDMDLSQMTYLILIGAFGIFFSGFLAAARRKTDVLAYKSIFSALRWIGMKKNDIGKLLILQSAMTALLGVIVGIIVGVSVPSFLAPEIQETSVFALQIPFGAAAISAAICLAASLLPFLRINKMMTW